jgi:predicted transcriptional regulator
MGPIKPPFLGDLEMAVMDHLWEHHEGDVRAVHEAVGAARGITPNTVQSTLTRLHHKGLLDRRKVSHAFVYVPQVDRAGFQRALLGEVVEGWMGGPAESVLSAFVELTARAGDEQLAALERLVAERLRQRGARKTP